MQTHQYIIMCYRSPLSVFGAAEAPMKGKGGLIETFETLEKAREEARRLNAKLTTSNVRYVAQEA